MIRLGLLVGVAAVVRVAAVVGVAAVIVVGCAAGSAPPPSVVDQIPATTSTTRAVVTTTEVTTTTADPDEGWFVVSVTNALPDSLTDGLASLDGVDAVSVVLVENLRLAATTTSDGRIVDRAPTGFSIPLEVHAIDAKAHAKYAPEAVALLLGELGPNEAVLSESSAAFRRLDPGAKLHLEGGTTLTVVGIVSDEWVGAAEAAVAISGAETLGIERARYAIVHFDGSVAELGRAAEGLTDAAVRVAGRDDVDVFRHADAVASQIAIKTMFGEFAFRPTGGDHIEIDPAWVEANIVEVEIPLLGNDQCHRRFVAVLREVMAGLEEAGLAEAIDPSAYLGCWNSRFIRRRSDLSRHAWGVAADINFGNEPDGSPGSPTDPALLEAMLELDILSGHTWTDPGPGHFEWYGTVGSADEEEPPAG